MTRPNRKDTPDSKTVKAVETVLFMQMEVEEASLLVAQGPHKGMVCNLEQEHIFLGRGDWCDVTLPKDAQVSESHCELSIRPDGVRVRDTGSLNGTFVDGCRILSAYLLPGQSLRIGDSVLTLQTEKAQKKCIQLNFFDDSGMLLGRSESMRRIFHALERIAPRSLPVLLTGETGTGKTTIAEVIHQRSPRSQGPFVVVNCGALPPSLIESALFGHEKGAFTGANQQHQGFFEQAHQGTLFLDEIGELPLDLQPKLLSVLETGRLQRVGGTETLQTDFRLIAATHRNLREEVTQGRFREDLFYRLHVASLEVPPLRERLEDIPLLADHLLLQIEAGQVPRFSQEAMERMQGYHWPGNVRELRNVLERAVLFLDGEIITVEDLPPPLSTPRQVKRPGKPTPSQSGTTSGTSDDTVHLEFQLKAGESSFKQIREDIECAILIKALRMTDGDVRKASYLLDISSPWMYKLMKKYNLKWDDISG